jgi:multiple sugar transport system permease protein
MRNQSLKIKSNIKNNLEAYLFLSPWIIGFILFSGFPILASFFISMTDWNMITSPKFILFKNYINMFSNQDFYNSLKVTIIFTILSILFTVIWALLLALLLNLKIRFIKFFQFVYFIPAVIPSVSLAFVFQLIYNQQSGILNYLLSFLGVKIGPNWLFDPKWVLPAVIFVCFFTYSTGQMMLIFKSALDDVSTELYEASSLDGANFLQKFIYITMPMISPVILFNTVMAAITSLNNSFSLLFPLTNGGPNGATNVLSLAIYRSGFQNYQMGYASALAVILFLIAALFSAVLFKISNNFVYYEN